MRSLDSLMLKLGYCFKKLELLQAALSHRSVRGQNNERLEFLGDSLLNFVIAEQLYHQFTTAKEGSLSRLRAKLVKGETLAEIAQEFQLGEYLRLGPGELKSGGFSRKSILGDALEAIIGAIYLDSDFETCKKQILIWFENRMRGLHPEEQKDPKTRLQEFLQSRHMPLPQYAILSIEGEAHAQIFHVECKVAGLSFITRSSGSNRRNAEQSAAKKYLELLKV